MSLLMTYNIFRRSWSSLSTSNICISIRLQYAVFHIIYRDKKTYIILSETYLSYTREWFIKETNVSRSIQIDSSVYHCSKFVSRRTGFVEGTRTEYSLLRLTTLRGWNLWEMNLQNRSSHFLLRSPKKLFTFKVYPRTWSNPSCDWTISVLQVLRLCIN